MQYQTSRILARNTHIAVAIYQCLYIYSPLHAMPHTFEVVQWLAFPLLLITGIWLRKGQVIWLAMAERFARRNSIAG